MFTYTVFIHPANSDDVISKHKFNDYDMALEFARIWETNGLVFTIVEHYEEV